MIADGSEVTVDGKTGRRLPRAPHPRQDRPERVVGRGIRGAASAHARRPRYGDEDPTSTSAFPRRPEEYARLPVSGVGLLRIEFIFTAHVRDHPLALIKKGKRDELVRRLAEGVGKVCQAFHPRPVIVRTSDFKTNEYRGDARRRAVRAGRGEPDDRLAGLLALHLAGLQAGVRVRARGDPPRAHRDGAEERHGDAPVRPEHLGARGDRGDAPGRRPAAARATSSST